MGAADFPDPFYEALERVVLDFSLVRTTDRRYVESFFERMERADYKLDTRFRFDRPLGTMRKKSTVRMGAFGPREEPALAFAYARWMQRHMSDRERKNALHEYLGQFDGAAFDEFMDQAHPKVPYARLGVITPVAWYSGRYVPSNDLLLRRALDTGFEEKVSVYRLTDMVVDDLSQRPAQRSEVPTPLDPADEEDEFTFFPGLRARIRSVPRARSPSR